MGLYTEAADIIRKVKAKKASVKTLVLSKSSYPNKKQLYALVCETLKNTELLKRVEAKLGLLQKEEALGGDEELLHVLLYDQLIGKGIKGAHTLRIAVQRYRSVLKAEYKRLKADNDADGRTNKLAPLPRYARVNFLKTTVDDVLSSLEGEGWRLTCTSDAKTTSQKFPDLVSHLSEDEFILDPDLPDLLVFPPGTDLHDHPLCGKGDLILQDKASCFPAHILGAPEGATVIDCCAAPGNKTSHIASLMKNSGKIFAFDKSESRLSTMKTLLSQAGVTCADVLQRDFLRVKPGDQAYEDVGYIMVDPSCSGSGMVNRLNEKVEDSPERLTSLSHFQISILKHALSFPNVQRVVYSTCSVHQEENEVVVDEVLSQFKGKFTLQEARPDWKHRGVEGNPCWKECIRMSPDQNLTNGFFVASFEKILDRTGAKAVTTDIEAHDINGGLETPEDCLALEDNRVRKQKKQKKRKHKDLENAEVSEHRSMSEEKASESLEQGEPKKKHKKSKKHSREMDESFDIICSHNNSTSEVELVENQHKDEEMKEAKKHKKKRKHDKGRARAVDEVTVESSPKLHKKKKKSKCKE